MQYLSFHVWFIPLSITFLRLIHTVACKNSFLLRLNNTQCMYVHFIYPLICQWMPDSLTSPGYCKSCRYWTWMYKYPSKSLVSVLWSIRPDVKFLDHAVILFLFFWRTAVLFLERLRNFTFPSTVCKGPNLSTSLPTLVPFCSSWEQHPNGCEVVSHSGFDLHFHND